MVSTEKKLDELGKICESYNIVATPTKNSKKAGGMVCSKSDYVLALQDYFIKKRKAEGNYSKVLEYIMTKDLQPMLAARISETSKTKDEVFKSKDWYAETKINGNRMMICNFIGESTKFFSRNLSTLDFLPVDYSSKIADINIDALNFIVDCEVVLSEVPSDEILEYYGLPAGATQLALTDAILDSDEDLSEFLSKYPLKFMVFDCMYWGETDMTTQKVPQRLAPLREIVPILSQAGLLVGRPRNNRVLKMTVEDFHRRMLMEGEEGSIVKDLNTTYCTDGSRKHEAWVKLKRSMEEAMTEEGLGDTIDAFVTGFANREDPNTNATRIGALELSVYLTDDEDKNLEGKDGNDLTRVIAFVSVLDEDYAKLVSEPDPDKEGYCKLKQSEYGKVFELSGKYLNPKTNLLINARCVRQRVDKAVAECKLRKSFLIG